MKTNYISPSIEVIEVEIEDAILQASPDSGTSSLDVFDDAGSAW